MAGDDRVHHRPLGGQAVDDDVDVLDVAGLHLRGGPDQVVPVLAEPGRRRTGEAEKDRAHEVYPADRHC